MKIRSSFVSNSSSSSFIIRFEKKKDEIQFLTYTGEIDGNTVNSPDEEICSDCVYLDFGDTLF